MALNSLPEQIAQEIGLDKLRLLPREIPPVPVLRAPPPPRRKRTLDDVLGDLNRESRALSSTLARIQDLREEMNSVQRISLLSLTEATHDMLASIAEEVSASHGFTVAALRGRGRTPSLCEARFEYYRQARSLGIQYEEIGAFVNRDHSTVMYGVNR